MFKTLALILNYKRDKEKLKKRIEDAKDEDEKKKFIEDYNKKMKRSTIISYCFVFFIIFLILYFLFTS